MTETQTQTRKRGPRQFTFQKVVRECLSLSNEYQIPVFVTNQKPKASGVVFDDDLGMYVETETVEDTSSSITVRIGKPKGKNEPFIEGNAKEVILQLRAIRNLARWMNNDSTEDPGTVHNGD